MNELNGIILNGKVYEAGGDGPCSECAFDKDVKMCDYICDLCREFHCIFRFSKELTDKLNNN